MIAIGLLIVLLGALRFIYADSKLVSPGLWLWLPLSDTGEVIFEWSNRIMGFFIVMFGLWVAFWPKR
jgi:hypothetical protein